MKTISLSISAVLNTARGIVVFGIAVFLVVFIYFLFFSILLGFGTPSNVPFLMIR